MPPSPQPVALFPIPNLVAFPGTVVPLHVFEPRYRRLVHDCVEAQHLIGVCHTRKTISQGRAQQTMEEALSANQATYQPHAVFSAGHCEIVETTPDGRILATILMQQRYSISEELQSLPYRIAACTPVEDDLEPERDAEARDLRRLITARLIDILRIENPEVADQFQSENWLMLTPGEFSFRLFQFVGFEPDLMQSMLETTSPTARLNLIWQTMRGARSHRW